MVRFEDQVVIRQMSKASPSFATSWPSAPSLQGVMAQQPPCWEQQLHWWDPAPQRQWCAMLMLWMEIGCGWGPKKIEEYSFYYFDTILMVSFFWHILPGAQNEHVDLVKIVVWSCCMIRSTNSGQVVFTASAASLPWRVVWTRQLPRTEEA